MQTNLKYILLHFLFLTLSGNVAFGAVIANDDSFTFQKTSDALVLNVLLNDNLSGTLDTSLSIVVVPEIGVLTVDTENNWLVFNLGDNVPGSYSFTYEVCGESPTCGYTCSQATVSIEIIASPVLPGGLTVDGNGLNSSLIIKGIEGINRLDITIVTRWGDLVYENRDYKNEDPWMGTIGRSGAILPEGAYYYHLRTYQNDVLIGKPIQGVIHLFE